jgi:hypothetical protein
LFKRRYECRARLKACFADRIRPVLENLAL